MFPATLFQRIRPALMKMAFVTLCFHRTRDENERKYTLVLQTSPKQYMSNSSLLLSIKKRKLQMCERVD